MDMTYRVSKNAYIELLADMVRCNDSRPVKLFTTFLLTLGQMAAVAVLCATRLEGRERVFAIVWSLLLAGITLLRRRTVRQRAKGTLQRLEYAGQLPEDYWREHRLRTAGNELRVSYGGQRLSCPLHAVGPVEERADALYIYCGGTIFDIIPAEAFKNADAMQRFARDLRAAAHPPGARRMGGQLRVPPQHAAGYAPVRVGEIRRDHSGRQDQPVRKGRSVLHHRVEQLPGGHPAGECGAVARNGGSAPQDRRAPLFHINPYVPAEQLRDRRKITK